MKKLVLDASVSVFVVALARGIPIVTHDREIQNASIGDSVGCYSAAEALRILGTT